MKEIIFDNLPSGNEYYTGAAKKESVMYENLRYMIKYPLRNKSRTELNQTYTNSVVSEYLGCHIINCLEIPYARAQNTLLGRSRGKIVVACEDFTTDDEKLISFDMLQNSYIDSSESGRHPILEDVIETLENHPSIKNREEAIQQFWSIFILDAFLGNFDRHSGNWGYLNNRKTGELKLAPIYDCGSCLYPQISEEGMRKVLEMPEEIERRWREFPNSAILDEETGKKINYYEFITSLKREDCNEALKRVFPLIDMAKVQKVVDDTPYISDMQKRFYKIMLQARYENILLVAYKCLTKVNEQSKLSEIAAKGTYSEREITGKSSKKELER
ncbi:HipA domain-containing protein [Clostridium formicaceticum]|uniref:Serine/threonine-protein kinase CtkA n=1 Tax=Clostridium formicaceticum TaxID=1497 RepID=A0AAC9RN66_9CLOT|nr:HipA domain-containing protein [Clostridium formicaceticum]AOY74725.1 hypothetical protein BJL90_01405 [Clostridium formicaceticum]ARE89111.1 Serine/threonine-protein kinase CtkA [Clostridium formicaceticum]